MMRCSTCFHELSFHFDEGCCYQQNGNICHCTVAFAALSSPPRVHHVPEEPVPVSPPQTCFHCGHAIIAHGPLGNCLACVPGQDEHVCRAVLVHEFVHAARTKYERLEVELGQALDEVESLKKKLAAETRHKDVCLAQRTRAQEELFARQERLDMERKRTETALGVAQNILQENTALKDQQLKVRWHIERAAGRLEEALKEFTMGQGGEE